MNIAVMPLAECAPLLLTPDMKPPRLATSRARKRMSPLACIIPCSSASGSTASATALPAGAQHVDLRALLVGGEVGLEEVMLDVRVLLDDPAARRLCGLAGEVLARRVAGRVVEARVEHAARRVLLDVEQLPRAGRRLRR